MPKTVSWTVILLLQLQSVSLWALVVSCCCFGLWEMKMMVDKAGLRSLAYLVDVLSSWDPSRLDFYSSVPVMVYGNINSTSFS